MIHPHVIQMLVEYHYSRWREVWRSIMALAEAQFLEPVAYSHGSLRDQLLHVIDDDAKWIALLRGQRHQPANPADFPTRNDARQHYDAIEAEHLAFVARLDEALLQKIFWWDTPIALVPQQVAGWQVLLHVVNHGTDHRAQVLRTLHDLGAPTFDQDLMRYLSQAGHIDPLHAGGGSDV